MCPTACWPRRRWVVHRSADPNFNGEDSFTYRADDGQADSNFDTLTITVDPINYRPVADPKGPDSGSAGKRGVVRWVGFVRLDGTIVSYVWEFVPA